MSDSLTFDDIVSDVAGGVSSADIASARETAEFLADNPVAFIPVRMFAVDDKS